MEINILTSWGLLYGLNKIKHIEYLLWVELCSPIIHVEVLSPNTSECDITRVVADVIKLSRGHTGVERATMPI